MSHDAEVEDLDLREVAVEEEEVRGLDVPVDEAARMREREALGGAADDGDALADCEAPAVKAVAEVLPVEPLHGDVGEALRGDAVGDVADDCGVVEFGERLAFTQEPADLGYAALLDHLERDALAGESIARAVDGAHAARSREAHDLEAVGDEGAVLHGGEYHTRRREAPAHRYALPAAPAKPFDKVEVFVARRHFQPMLDRQRCNPNVVLRDGTTASSQTLPDSRVGVGGGQAYLEDHRLSDQIVQKWR